MNHLYILAVLLVAFLLPLSAQEHVSHTESKHANHDKHEKINHFRVGVAISHTYIGTTTIQGKQTIIVPSLGLDLEYWFNHKWGVGFHNDLEIESFILEENNEEIVEKNYPALVTFDALWRPWKGLVLLAGFGAEFEKSENLQVARLGVEYEIEFGNHWDVFPTIFYDNRKDAHNTFSVGIGLGKHF